MLENWNLPTFNFMIKRASYNHVFGNGDNRKTTKMMMIMMMMVIVNNGHPKKEPRRLLIYDH